jgi:hypothetical protein
MRENLGKVKGMGIRAYISFEGIPNIIIIRVRQLFSFFKFLCLITGLLSASYSHNFADLKYNFVFLF